MHKKPETGHNTAVGPPVRELTPVECEAVAGGKAVACRRRADAAAMELYLTYRQFETDVASAG